MLLVDADTAVVGDLSPLWTLPAAFAGVWDQSRWLNRHRTALHGLNGGVLFLRPCAAVARHMTALLEQHPKLRFTHGTAEQEFLTWYFRYTGITLPLEYNVQVGWGVECGGKGDFRGGGVMACMLTDLCMTLAETRGAGIDGGLGWGRSRDPRAMLWCIHAHLLPGSRKPAPCRRTRTCRAAGVAEPGGQRDGGGRAPRGRALHAGQALPRASARHAGSPVSVQPGGATKAQHCRWDNIGSTHGVHRLALLVARGGMAASPSTWRLCSRLATAGCRVHFPRDCVRVCRRLAPPSEQKSHCQ